MVTDKSHGTSQIKEGLRPAASLVSSDPCCRTPRMGSKSTEFNAIGVWPASTGCWATVHQQLSSAETTTLPISLPRTTATRITPRTPWLACGASRTGHQTSISRGGNRHPRYGWHPGIPFYLPFSQFAAHGADSRNTAAARLTPCQGLGSHGSSHADAARRGNLTPAAEVTVSYRDPQINSSLSSSVKVQQTPNGPHRFIQTCSNCSPRFDIYPMNTSPAGTDPVGLTRRSVGLVLDGDNPNSTRPGPPGQMQVQS